MTKKELRQYIRQQKKAYTQEQLVEMSTPIVQKLLAHPHIQAAKIIMLYASLTDEVYTHDLIKQLSAQGKTILLPVVTGEHTMKICYYTGENQVKEGSFGIMEPMGEEFTNYQQIDVALIPGMAFDKHGNRLGRGKGYYDRFLSQAPSVYKIGVCFPFQRVDEVPTEENDVRMDE